MELDLGRHFNEKDIQKSEDEDDKDFKISTRSSKKITKREALYQLKREELKKEKARKLFQKIKKDWKSEEFSRMKKFWKDHNSSGRDLTYRANRTVKAHLRIAAKSQKQSG